MPKYTRGKNNLLQLMQQENLFVPGEIISVEIEKYNIKQYFLIEEASHTWNGGLDYNMTLTLKGGVID